MTNPKVGKTITVRLNVTCALERHKVAEVYQSPHGGILYVLDNGQILTRNEIKVEGEK